MWDLNRKEGIELAVIEEIAFLVGNSREVWDSKMWRSSGGEIARLSEPR
jgi:DnaJ-domain-containing protein 1